MRKCSNLTVLHVLFSFHSIAYWRVCLFSTMYSWLLCHRLIDHRCLNLFLGPLFCSINLYVYFYAIAMLFWLLWLCNILWSLGWWYLQLCSFFPQYCFGSWGFIWFHVNFRLFVPVLWKMLWVFLFLFFFQYLKYNFILILNEGMGTTVTNKIPPLNIVTWL